MTREEAQQHLGWRDGRSEEYPMVDITYKGEPICAVDWDPRDGLRILHWPDGENVKIILLGHVLPSDLPVCRECSKGFDDNPGSDICKTCEDWIVKK